MASLPLEIWAHVARYLSSSPLDVANLCALRPALRSHIQTLNITARPHLTDGVLWAHARVRRLRFVGNSAFARAMIARLGALPQLRSLDLTLRNVYTAPERADELAQLLQAGHLSHLDTLAIDGVSRAELAQLAVLLPPAAATSLGLRYADLDLLATWPDATVPIEQIAAVAERLGDAPVADTERVLRLAAELEVHEYLDRLLRLDGVARHGARALADAVSRRSPRVMRQLLEANVAQPRNALLRVCQQLGEGGAAAEECALLLLAHGANPNRAGGEYIVSSSDSDSEELNFEYTYPLRLACLHGAVALTRALLRAGATACVEDMALAIGGGHLACARLLVEMGGVAMDATGDTGRTALMLACRNGSLSAVHALLEMHGADHAWLNATDDDHWTALMCACSGGHTECARALVEAGAFLWCAEALGGKTALMLACEDGHVECARLLLSSGAQQRRDREGNTELMVACANGHELCARVLLAHGADANARNDFGETALWLSCLRGHAGCARALLEAPAAPAQVDALVRGHTALMLACQQGEVECVRVLLGAGASPSRRFGRWGPTAHDIAMLAGNHDCAELLGDDDET